jgi:hypothetical protein
MSFRINHALVTIDGFFSLSLLAYKAALKSLSVAYLMSCIHALLIPAETFSIKTILETFQLISSAMAASTQNEQPARVTFCAQTKNRLY